MLALLAIACSIASAAAPPHDHGPAPGGDAPPPAARIAAAPYDEPADFEAALALVGERAALLAAMAAGGGLEMGTDVAAAHAATIRDVSKTLVRRAMTGGSGFPPERIRDLLFATRELTERAERAAALGSVGAVDDTSHAISEVVSSVAGIRRIAGAAEAAAPASGSPYSVEIISTPARVRADEETALQWIVSGPDGAQVEEFELIDGEHMHLAAASRDGSFLAVHAPQLRPNHRFTLPVTLPAPGEYVLFQEVRPAGAESQVVVATLSVPGAPPGPVELAPDLAPKPTGAETASIALPDELVAGREAEIRVRVVDDKGAPAALERVAREGGRTGGFGRLTAVHAGATGAVFASADEGASAAGDGELVFRAVFPEAGLYRAEAEFQHKLYRRRASWVFEVTPAPEPRPE